MATLLLIVRLALAAVFALAAAGKLADGEGARTAVARFGAPLALAGPLAIVLTAVELAIAAGLVIVTSAALAAVAAAALLVLFSLAIARVLARGEAPDCHCFGTVGAAPVGRSTLARNAALLAAAAFVAIAGRDGAGTSLGDVGAGVLVVGALIALQAAFSWQLFQQNGRLLGRVSALEERLGDSGPRQVDADVPLAIGTPAPAFALPDLAGATTTLEDLLRPGRGLLLVFSDPGCGHCDPLLPALGRPRGADDVPLAVVSRGPHAENRAKAEEHGVGPVLLQEEYEVADAYRVLGLPGAVLLDAAGRIASTRAVGAGEVAALLDGDGARPERLPLVHVEGRS
ncbi:MAG: hypothetical protein JWQ48_2194 [Conexibacter sp.]|nr:hypothetical protein [Conexibacter sp.]